MLQVQFGLSGDALLVTPFARRLDASAGAELVAAARDHVRGHALVVVSLAHVQAVDASGLGALVALHQRMPPGATLRLAHAAPEVRSLLEATFLDEVFPAFDDEAEAVRSQP